MPFNAAAHRCSDTSRLRPKQVDGLAQGVKRACESTCRLGVGAKEARKRYVCGLRTSFSTNCAVIGNPREPLLKRASAVPRPQSGRLSQPCCNGSVWDMPAPPNCADIDRSRPERRLRQPGWKRL